LNRLHKFGFIEPVEGSFPRWKVTRPAAAQRRSVFASAFPPLVCLRLLGEANKERAMREVLMNAHDARRFVVAPEDLKQVPNTPFAYWVSNRVRRLFKELTPFESDGRTVKQGMATSDDFRFLRNWWEVPATALCRPDVHPNQRSGAYCILGGYSWFSLAKGGSYSPYYVDLDLVVNWKNDGEEIKTWAGSLYGGSHWSRIIKNTDYYFQAGLTYPLRTAKFSPQFMPAGTIISVRGLVFMGKT